ncbi:MAG: flagellar protein FlaG [Betaproteobacteria bacterium]|jgi:flagellar protein FlaG|nr:flagellar protein FlaG [Betaproteobacteria bacterium]MBK7080957.1 flagellar protein FlaG [Betaproteobacteria bacterium]MBK7743961.1 flagellar protein FlaG [Betaproteobacteria bacterium]MBK8687341.1 flagellar protein FlaG [Betaproteobacteria bacterium]MBK9676502.1 flagellar protein FlaG [Betaproteobacteria bacterium]
MLIQNMQGLVPAAAPAPTGRAAPWCPASELLAVGMRPLVEVKPAVDPAAAPPPAGEVQVAVTQANRTMAALSAALMFEVDAETHTTVVKVVDTSDNRVLRQIPSQEMLDIAQALDRLQGMLVRDQA